MTSFLKVLILVNALLAVTFGIFIELCHLLASLDLSPWLAIPGTMAFCGFIYMKTIRVITRRFG